MPNSTLTLAVAGSRKTQGIVEDCANSEIDTRVLVLTYTIANQRELKNRLAQHAGKHKNIEVMGWFTFLIKHFVKPFLPCKYPDVRVLGFDFNAEPSRYKNTHDIRRYFNNAYWVKKVHLPQLAYLLHSACSGETIERLAKIYDVIYIDEVQDLGGYDLEILRILIDSAIRLEMVGDIRQAILLTNERELKNKQYKYMKVWDWYRKLERDGLIEIIQKCQSYRCRQEICDFADALFTAEWGFEKTESLNNSTTEHDGLYTVAEVHLGDYVERYSPMLLRSSKSSGKHLDYPFINFGVCKGMSRKNVLIFPTGAIKNYLVRGIGLDDQQAASLYTAVTRAEQSVAFVLEEEPVSDLFVRWVK